MINLVAGSADGGEARESARTVCDNICAAAVSTWERRAK